MDEQLGYDRYDVKGKETDDIRNGHRKKILRTSFGDTTIQMMSFFLWPETLIGLGMQLNIACHYRNNSL